MEKNNLNEDLERFNNLIDYNPLEGNVVSEAKTRKTYLSEEEPEGEEAPAEEEEIDGADFDFGDEGSPEGEEEPTEEAPAEEEPVEDEFGTAEEFTASDELEDEGEGEVEEIDVTAIVGKSEEAKDLAQKKENAELEKTVGWTRLDWDERKAKGYNHVCTGLSNHEHSKELGRCHDPLIEPLAKRTENYATAPIEAEVN